MKETLDEFRNMLRLQRHPMLAVENCHHPFSVRDRYYVENRSIPIRDEWGDLQPYDGTIEERCLLCRAILARYKRENP